MFREYMLHSFQYLIFHLLLFKIMNVKIYSVTNCILQHNCHILAAFRSCMPHYQELAATATKITQTRVQLFPPSCYVTYWLLLLCMSILFNILLNNIFFLYELYVQCVSIRMCQGKCCHKFPGNTVPSTTDIHELLRKSGLLDHF
jgi:hypothetical protein